MTISVDPRMLAALDELVDSGDAVRHATALRLCRAGLYAALLSPARARTHLVRLLDSRDPGVVAGALAELARPWAALDPLAPELLRRFVAAAGTEAGGPGVAAAALTAAARHGLPGLLVDAVADRGLTPDLRQYALTLLGNLAEQGHLGEITALAGTDPLLLGGPAIVCLLAMHRRGLFPAGAQAAAIVTLALVDHTIAPRDVATILFTARHETLAALLAAEPGDPSWPRRLALLVALAEQGAPELAIGQAIAELLPAAIRIEPFLDALRALRYAAAEDAVLAVLPRAPGAALRALEAIGGPRTTSALTRALDGSVASYLRSHRHRALDLCWQLTEEPHRRQALLRRLDPDTLSPRIAADLGRPDERELAVLRAGLDPNRPTGALVRLARDGDTSTVPAVADVLGRIVAELANAWDTRVAGSGGTAPSGDPPASHDLYGLLRDMRGLETGGPTPAEREPVVSQDAVDAIRDLGRRLHRWGRIRPVYLLDAATEEAAGDALVAGIALDLLDRPALSATEQAVLIELLTRTPYAGTRARVHRLLRHRDPAVRKRVIAVLANDGYGAEALSATLTSLTGAQDVQTVRQALLALGRIGARWASPAIAACLDHPTMNVRKTAAEALCTAGTPAAVPQVLHRLGRHDNPGLRTALTRALWAILGDAAAATLLAAAELAEPGRSRDLLLEALDRRLPADSVAALVDQGSPVGPALQSLVAAGRMTSRAEAPQWITDDSTPQWTGDAAAPPWVGDDRTYPVDGPSPAPGDDVLDQPRSAALRERLLTLLAAPEAGQRQRAADALRHWPEPEIRIELLRAHLRGEVALPHTTELARTLADTDPAELRGDRLTETGRERAARLAGYLDPTELNGLIPPLLDWWEHGSPATRAAAERSLRRPSADALAAALSDRLDAGAWGFVRLLTAGPLLRTPALTTTVRRLRADGRDDLADQLRLVPGPLLPEVSATPTPETGVGAGALAALRERPPTPIAAPRATREELFAQARSGDTAQIHAVLARLAEAKDAGAGPSDTELAELLDHLVRHPQSTVRLRAHRLARRLLDERTYLRHTEILLGDPQPQTVRSAIRTVSHASWLPAIPAIVGLLRHPDPGVRQTAAKSLLLYGAPAVPALTHAAGRARPDKRGIYSDILAQLADR